MPGVRPDDARGDDDDADGVTADWLAAGSYAVEVNGERHAVRAQLQPFYDPDRKRVLA